MELYRINKALGLSISHILIFMNPFIILINNFGHIVKYSFFLFQDLIYFSK